jgi:hypothetical protein
VGEGADKTLANLTIFNGAFLKDEYLDKISKKRQNSSNSQDQSGKIRFLFVI